MATQKNRAETQFYFRHSSLLDDLSEEAFLFCVDRLYKK